MMIKVCLFCVFYTVSMHIPLCEFQVWRVVNHSRRFPIQGLPFQTKAMDEKPHREHQPLHPNLMDKMW